MEGFCANFVKREVNNICISGPRMCTTTDLTSPRMCT